MKPLNKNLDYDCSNLSEEEMRELKKETNLNYKPKLIYYNRNFNKWFRILNDKNNGIDEFTDAKTLFE